MGAEARSRSPLHPATDSPARSPRRDDAVATDLATDISQRTDKSSFSIPEDGSPVTITTNRNSRNPDEAFAHNSATSLLIEYFEGGKGPDESAKPSIRVKVTPSSSKKGRHSKERSAEAADAGAARKPSYTRRVSLGHKGQVIEHINPSRSKLRDDSSLSPRPRAPVDISDLEDVSEVASTTLSNQEHYSDINPSQLSSMPPESLLESEAPATPKRSASPGPSRDEIAIAKAHLAAPLERSRSVSKERLTRKVIEKLGKEPGLSASSGKEHKTRSRSVSKEHLEETSSSRRRSGKHRSKEEGTSSEPSLLNASQISDGRSARSGASKSSLNNPKLLETVEDAIRRLILPELTALKNEQKTQKNRDKFERLRRESESSTVSRDELGRRLSKHSSDPSVHGRNRSVEEDDIALIKKKARGQLYDYPSEKIRSEETVIRDGEKPRHRRSKESHRSRDAAGALAAGVLTREALKHHDSHSSLERRERRRKRNKSGSRSHSRTDSQAESEDPFEKHDVPPMPNLRSELTGSDMTRDSLLSERTSTPTSERRRVEIRQVARGSPLGSASPSKPGQQFEDTHDHEHEYEERRSYGDGGYGEGHKYRDLAGAGMAGAAAGLGAAALAHPTSTHYYDDYSHQYGGGHTLSPIQSVASLEEEAERQKHVPIKARGTGMETQRSTETFSSAEGTKTRSKGGSFNNFNPRDSNGESFSGSRGSAKHLSGCTEESVGDNVSAAQQIRGIGANPEYIETPFGVESAVASLYEPSVLDNNSNLSGRSRTGDRAQSEPLSDDQYDRTRYVEYDRPASTSNLGSPLKNQVMREYEDEEMPDYDAESPRQSPAKEAGSTRDFADGVELSHSGIPNVNDPMPAIGHYHSKSDISTNPSIIQGPGHGLDKESTPWIYNQSHENTTSDHGSHGSQKAAADKFLAAAAGAAAGAGFAGAASGSRDKNVGEVDTHNLSRDIPPTAYGNKDPYPASPQRYGPFSPIPRDEGYETGAHAHSPSLTPDQRGKAPLLFGGDVDDVFGPSDMYGQPRTLSADSHGAASPLYDAATGKGIDRIQSKDIVALMNHLTVRDAQRNARDTEILVTIVQIATELRTSFTDVKKFIQEQDDTMVEVTNKQHEKTQRVIGGPRPQPPSSTRLPRTASDEAGDDKRGNVFRRALRNLGGRNNDITKVEDMLNTLLGEVADLKAAQGVENNRIPRDNLPVDGVASYEMLRDGQQSGYEPEGRAGTSSNADNSGYFSNASSQHTARPQSFGRRRTSENRISTVMEADEETEAPLEPHEQQLLSYEDPEELLTPTRTRRTTFGAPAAPDTTPTIGDQPTTSASADNTPRTDKSKKHHKSSSSSFFPKISRWSKTTASTVADNVRRRGAAGGSGERPDSNVSQSGSDDMRGYDVAEHYDPQGDDRLRSATSLNRAEDVNRPPSPLVPSGLSEKPTYRAHRDSMNLQHPQPRQGPTARFQNHLESQVQAQSMSPVSPSSDHFGSNPVLARYPAANRYSGGAAAATKLSPISDAAGRSDVSGQGPPRPPKVRDDGPLVPAKVPLDEERRPTYAERSAAGQGHAETSGARRSFSNQSPPQRKPTGPRPIVSSGSYSQERTRYRGSPNPVDSLEDVTF